MDSSSQMLSLPPEPPDIRNWFESYESPQLSESEDGSGDAIEEHGRALKGAKLLEEDEIVGMKEFGKSNSMLFRDDSVNRISILNKCDFIVEDSEEIAAASLEAVPHKLNSDTDPPLAQLPTSLFEDQTKSEVEERQVEARISRDQHTDDLTSKGLSKKITKPPLANNNLEKNLPAQNDGFISTKKKREDYGFSNNEMDIENKSRKILQAKNMGDASLHKDRHGKTTGKENSLPRETSSKERANFEVKVGTPEISGKWLCPQKNKPYIAPPMKQLGLERWFRHLR